MRKHRFWKTLALTAAVLALAWAPSAIASLVPGINLGDDPQPSITTQHDYIPSFKGWFIGPFSVNSPLPAGGWEKELLGPQEGQPLGNRTYNLFEVIRVGDGAAWTGWQEEILTDGWNWVKGSIFAFTSAESWSSPSSLLPGGSLSPFSGLTHLDNGDVNGQSIQFDFTPLSTDTWLFIWKKLKWGGPSGPSDDSIKITERMSTVPIPAAGWMLGAGLLGLIAIRRRRQER